MNEIRPKNYYQLRISGKLACHGIKQENYSIDKAKEILKRPGIISSEKLIKFLIEHESEIIQYLPKHEQKTIF